MNRQETIKALGALLPKMEGKDRETIETAINLLKPKSIAISQEQIELLDALEKGRTVRENSERQGDCTATVEISSPRNVRNGK